MPVEDDQARILRPNSAMCLLCRGIVSLDLRSSGRIAGTVAGKDFDGSLYLLRTGRERQLSESHCRLAFRFSVSHESLCRCATRRMLLNISLERRRSSS